MTFDALYADVLAAPGDDLPRRVLADWLSEQGDPLGELMRLQLDLAEQGPRAPRSARLGEAQLLALHQADWQERFAPWAYEVIFSRGLPAMAWAGADLLARRAAQAQPLPGLHLVLEVGSDQPPESLASLPLFQHVESLDLAVDRALLNRGQVSLLPWLRLVESFPRLTALRLDGLGGHPRDSLQLARLLERLRPRRLALHGLPLGREAAERVLDGLSHVEHLEELDLTGCWLSGLGPPVAQIIRRTGVRWVDVSHCMLEGPSVRDIAEAAGSTGRCVARVGSNARAMRTHEARVAGWSPAALAAARFDAPPAPEDGQVVPLRRAVGRVGPWVLQDLVNYDSERLFFVATCGDLTALLVRWREPPTDLGQEPNFRQRHREVLVRATRALVGLTHPNLLRWLDAGFDGGGLYTARELVDGEPLWAVCQAAWAEPAGAASARRVAEVGVDLARALVALHAEGLLQPFLGVDTTFLCRDGRARLVPLPAGSPSNRRPRLYEFSPEQLRGASVDARSDLYRLGAVLYQLLIEPRPVGRGAKLNEVGDLPSGILAALRPLPTSVPPPLRAAIERLLAPRPEDRPATAEEALLELARAGNLPLTPRPLYEPAEQPDWLRLAWTQQDLWNDWGLPDDPRT